MINFLKRFLNTLEEQKELMLKSFEQQEKILDLLDDIRQESVESKEKIAQLNVIVKNFKKDC